MLRMLLTPLLLVVVLLARAPPACGSALPFLNGVDLSYVPQAEAQGFKYYATRAGKQEDPVTVVARNGANIARLRIWNDPPYPNQTYATLSNAVRMAKRVRAAGMAVHLDLQFSDWWADPGKQWMPRAWSGCSGWEQYSPTSDGCRDSIPELAELVYNFTGRAVHAVTEATGSPPEVIQVGNEITNGMLWTSAPVECAVGGGTWRQPQQAQVTACEAAHACAPNRTGQGCRHDCRTLSDCGSEDNVSACAKSYLDGRQRCSNWPRLVGLLNASIGAVRAASPTTKVMVHLSDWGKAIWWLNMAEAAGIAPFDMLGVSYYQQFRSLTSGGPLNILRCNCSWCLGAVQARWPELPIVIVETSYPFETFDNPWNFTELNSDFEFSPRGQAAYLASLLQLAKESAMGGVYWWCPECADGYWRDFSSAYFHQALFDHDGVALEAQKAWSKPEASWTECSAALRDACPWSGGRCSNCSACVDGAAAAGALRACSEGAKDQWCLGVFGPRTTSELRCV